MKILYAIQGTGNGHLSRAMDVAPALQQHGKVDYLISGAQSDLTFPYEVKFKLKGLSFYFGTKGGIDFKKTFIQNSSRRVFQDIRDLPIGDYDLIINDFEPISAWAARLRGKRVIALSHQSALLSPKCPRPPVTDLVGQSVLKNYAPADQHYGFHFNAFDNHIFTPIVRRAIREQHVVDNGHYVVYLPAYSDEKIVKVLSQIKVVDWIVFSKHSSGVHYHKNIKIVPVNGSRFIQSLTSCSGVLCGAGFETPSEALYLGKKLMVIPMKGQYEQQCNAAALIELGVPVIKKLGNKLVPQIQSWVNGGAAQRIHYPDDTEAIVEQIVERETIQLKDTLLEESI